MSTPNSQPALDVVAAPTNTVCEKKIEPTDAMVRFVVLNSNLMGTDVRTILRAALNHPDARGLFAGADDRPWKPLNGRKPRVGDEVRQDAHGFTRTAVVGGIDEEGDPVNADGGFIGQLYIGTWYFRRPVQELPTTEA